MFLRAIYLVIAVTYAILGVGQSCSNPGQLPTTSFPVCGANVFVQTTVPECAGSPVATPCSSSGYIFYDKNPFWYKFTCYQSGTLGFVITPNTLTDDYDWQLFDYTGFPASAVYTNSSLFLSCNWSGVVGLTGASASGTGNIHCEGNGVPTFNQMPALIQGHNYLLMVSHFDDGNQSGYTLQFNGGTAGITDTTTSAIANASVNCIGNKVSMKLNKKLKCSSLAANGSDFVVSAPGVSVASAVGVNCSSGFDMDSIVLMLSSSLPPGTYSVSSAIGTDGNTLLDYCDAPMVTGSTASFTVLPVAAATMDSIKNVCCAPKELFVVLNSSVLCSSIATNGSDFSVTGPTSVAVLSAAAVCSGGTTNMIKLTLANAIKTGGIYQVTIKLGTDGNTLLNSCQIATPAGDAKTVATVDTVSALFTYRVNRSCSSDTIRFFGNAGAALFGYNWLLDTARSIIQNPLEIYASGGTHIARLIVSNGVCSDTVKQSIVLPALVPLTLVVKATAESCNKGNGTASVVASGGSGPHTYLWMPGNLITPAISNLTAGKYYITVTDSLGCQKTDSVIVDSFSSPVITNIAPVNVKCYSRKDGSITVTATGGLQPYTCLWTSTIGTFTGNPLLNADTGKYTLLLTDSRGCTAIGNAVTITQPLPINHTAVVTNALCKNADGAASVTVSGGTIPYTYKWQPTGGNTPIATSLVPDIYVLTTTDGNGCMDTAAVTVRSIKGIRDSIAAIGNSCLDVNTGSATIVSFGAAPYTYNWLPFGGNAATATQLATGTYTVYVSDRKNCADTLTINIGNNIPIGISPSVTHPVSCFGDKDGEISLNASGAAPFSYSWTPPVSTSSAAKALQTGTYKVVVKDSFGCSASQNIALSQPELLWVRVLSKNTTCGLANGVGEAAVQGGTKPYRFAWSNGGNQQIISNFSAGGYSLMVIDSNGCKADNNAVYIKNSVPLKISLGNDFNLCPGDSFQLSPGNFLTYQWQDGAVQPVYVVKHAGTYSVQVTDADNCPATASVEVKDDCDDLLFPGGFTPDGDGRNDGFGPLGTLPSVSRYSLHIYNRLGNEVFTSSNPYQKWDGKIKTANAATGTYVWMVSYSFNGKPTQVKKGTIVLIR